MMLSLDDVRLDDDDCSQLMIVAMMVMVMTLLEPLMIDDFDGALEI